jgi:hypothetical protein
VGDETKYLNMKNIKSQDCPSFSESHPLSKREELILRKHLDTSPFFTRKDDGYYFIRNKSLDGSNYGYYRFDNIYEIIELLNIYLI